MHVRARRHGHEKREVVDAGGQVRERAAHPSAGLAMLREVERAAHDVARLRLRSFDVPAGVELLAVALDERGLVAPPFMNSWTTRFTFAR
jgi:hypothetical protein